MEVTWLGGRVLVRHALGPAETGGGIVIPEKYRGRAQEGVVLGVAKGWWTEEDEFVPIEDIEVGDRVLFEKRKGQVVEVGEDRLRILHYRDVVARLKVGKVEVCPGCGGTGGVVTDGK